MPQGGISRRELIELGATLGLAGAFPAAAAAREDAPRPVAAAGKSAKNIIFMVSDGMSLGVPSLAEPFSQLTRKRGTNFYRLWQDPRTTMGFFETHSLNSLVTDSAAASSAWSSGSRVFNASINVLPDGTNLTPITALAIESGRRVGLVTTTTITHATPAGFATNQPNRDDEHLIAPQYLDKIDVLMGGGDEFFDAAKRDDKHDLYADFAGKGYAIWKKRDDLTKGERPQRVLGIFAEGHIPFTLDRDNRPELAKSTPTLAEMTAAALDILGKSESGFLLQVEGGRVDHAAHHNDAAAIMWDQLAFDDAVAVVQEFADKRSDTLVIITTDHGNSNPGLIGMGDEYRNSTACFEKLTRATVSIVRMEKHLQKLKKAGELTPEAALAYLCKSTGLPLTTEHAQIIGETLDGAPAPTINEQHRVFEGALGEILCNFNGVGWTGISHTEDLAIVLATGPGREQFAGLWRNTDACEKLSAMMGVKHANPRMSPEDAKRYLTAAPIARRPHWA